MANNKEKLFSEFPPVSTEQWMAKITEDLKGADFEKKLVWRTNEGFKVQPFYRADDLKGLDTDTQPGQFPYRRGTKACSSWAVRQGIGTKDIKAANAKALDILGKGVNSLGFCCAGRLIESADLESLLEGICAECVELNFFTSPALALEQAKVIAAYFEKKGYDKSKVRGSISFDPMGYMMKSGVKACMADAKALVELLCPFKKFRCLTVSAGMLADSGAFCYQELGYALAWGNEYMRSLTEAGTPAECAAKKIYFNFSISSNYFMEIAKFRAARMLWAQIVQQYEPKCDCACKMCVNAITTSYNMTIFDAHVNLLRSQTESMSAAIAGVHSIVVTPFDATYETPTDFSERIARNQQLLLKEECHFDKVVDPASGSYYIEELTTSLAAEGWKIFLKVEEDGGFLAAALAGTIQDDINTTNEKRHLHAAQRREFILGTNQFPNFTEKSEGKQPLACKCSCGSNEESTIKSINATRLAADFENLRLATEKAPKQPVAFMVTIGSLVWRQARAQFSCNFLAAAGIKVIDNLGFKTIEEGVDAALAAGADIVVICSSDDEYAEYAIPAYKYLDGRAMFVVAGAPACGEDLKAAGIENFINVKSNQLATLKEYTSKLGI